MNGAREDGETPAADSVPGLETATSPGFASWIDLQEPCNIDSIREPDDGILPRSIHTCARSEPGRRVHVDQFCHVGWWSSSLRKQREISIGFYEHTP